MEWWQLGCKVRGRVSGISAFYLKPKQTNNSKQRDNFLSFFPVNSEIIFCMFFFLCACATNKSTFTFLQHFLTGACASVRTGSYAPDCIMQTQSLFSRVPWLNYFSKFQQQFPRLFSWRGSVTNATQFYLRLLDSFLHVLKFILDPLRLYCQKSMRPFDHCTITCSRCSNSGEWRKRTKSEKKGSPCLYALYSSCYHTWIWLFETKTPTTYNSLLEKPRWSKSCFLKWIWNEYVTIAVNRLQCMGLHSSAGRALQCDRTQRPRVQIPLKPRETFFSGYFAIA